MVRARGFTRVLSILGLAASVMAACAEDNGAGGPLSSGAGAGGSQGSSGSGATDVGAPDCEGPLGPPRDPAGLPECCPEHGEAHCVEVPADFQSLVSPCESGGHCVPDDFISTGGVFTPVPCAAFDGSQGVCLSACIPQIAEVASILEQDVCKASERCAPCVFGGKDTGACDIVGSCEDGGSASSSGDAPACDDPATCEYDCATPALDPSALPACPDCGGGHCVPTAQIPDPSLLDQLAACDASSVCVPDDIIVTNGKLVPSTCKSVAGSEGRCLSSCLPAVSGQLAQLPQDVCPDTHKCVPCYDPQSGEDTGACRVSCDTGPTGPPQTFAKCCNNDEGVDEGTCIPSSLVPADQADQLGEDSCPQDSGAALCVPDVFLQAQTSGMPYLPATCDTGFWIQSFFGDEFSQGACLPECIPEVDDTPFLVQDDCPEAWKCVPCQNPQTGESSGACDPKG
jgi:hypothetical protein